MYLELKNRLDAHLRDVLQGQVRSHDRKHSAGDSAGLKFRRVGDADRLRTGAQAAQGAEGDCAGDCGGAGHGAKGLQHLRSQARDTSMRGWIVRRAVRHDCERRRRADPATSGIHSLVEHTSINPNKAAHIGHLRNAILGDTFVRLLRAAGQQVDGAELHRQHRRAGGGCGGGLSAPGEEIAGRSACADCEKLATATFERDRLLLLGSLCADSQWYTSGTAEENEARKTLALRDTARD